MGLDLSGKKKRQPKGRNIIFLVQTSQGLALAEPIPAPPGTDPDALAERAIIDGGTTDCIGFLMEPGMSKADAAVWIGEGNALAVHPSCKTVYKANTA